MFEAFGTNFIEIDNKEITILLSRTENGLQYINVRGGVMENGIPYKETEYPSAQRCLEEVEKRMISTLLYQTEKISGK